MKRPRISFSWIMGSILLIALPGLILVWLWSKSPAETGAIQPEPTHRIETTKPSNGGPRRSPAGGSAEQPLTFIPVTGRLAEADAEISGLAWYGDYLIMLPQYPRHVTGGEEGYIYALSKADILNYLDGKTEKALDPISIRFDAYKLRDQMPNFQGFESIGFLGERVYVTVESGPGNNMMGYLLSGTAALDLSQIEMDSSKLAAIEPQAALNNKADEALVVLDDRILTFYEVNGAAFNSAPRVHVFNPNLELIEILPSPPIEYRMTDAARVPGTNRFWVLNSFFLGDLDLLPGLDPLADEFGRGPTHSKWPMVERLVEMEYIAGEGVRLTGMAPIQLELAPLEMRNWEGLTILDNRGFLLATDKNPSTLLAFVPFP